MNKITACALATVLGISLSFAQNTDNQNTDPKTQTEQQTPKNRRQPDQKKKQAARRAKLIARRTQNLNEKAAAIMAEFDKDKDGKLSEQEKHLMQDAVDKARKTLMMAHQLKMIQKIDDNNDMVITEAELEAKFEVLQNFHKNNPRNGRKNMNRTPQQL